MASGREQREEDGFRQSKATSAMPHRLRRKASIIDRWPRHQVNNDKHSMSNSYISLSLINDCDYPFHLGQACHVSDGDQIALSDCSLTELLSQTAYLDCSIVGLLATPASQLSSQQRGCQSPSTASSTSNVVHKSKHSSKPIGTRMKSFSRNRTPKPRRTLAFLWTSLSNHFTLSLWLSLCLSVCLWPVCLSITHCLSMWSPVYMCVCCDNVYVRASFAQGRHVRKLYSN